MASPIDAIFRVAADLAANWASVNPVLKPTELGLETDTGKLKYGDGVTAWNALGYFSEPPTAASRALASLIPAADRMPYFTSASAAAMATVTSYARTLLDDVDAAAARTTLGLGSASITGIAALTPAADRLPYYTSASAAALATLTSYARTLLDDADAATARTTLGLGTAATSASTAFVPSTGIKGISGRTTQSSAEASQYSLSVLNTDANGWGHYIQAGTAAADRTFRVANGSGAVRFDIFSDGRIAAYNLPVYADNAAAVAGALPASHLYRTATGEVRIRI